MYIYIYVSYAYFINVYTYYNFMSYLTHCHTAAWGVSLGGTSSRRLQEKIKDCTPDSSPGMRQHLIVNFDF